MINAIEEHGYTLRSAAMRSEVGGAVALYLPSDGCQPHGSAQDADVRSALAGKGSNGGMAQR